MDNLTVQNHLDTVREEFINTAKSFTAYTEVLNLSGFMGMDPRGYKYISDSMEHIQTIFGKPIETVNSVEFMFNLYYEVYKCLETIYKSFDIFADSKIKSSEVGIHRAESVITTSLVNESEVKFNICESTCNKIIDTVADAKLSYNMTEHIFQDIIPEVEKLIEISDVINNEYHKYAKSGTSIYVYTLYVTMLDTLFDLSLNIKNSAQITRHLTKMLEETKSKLLVPHLGTRLTHNRNENTIQKFIQTYRLVPATDCMSMRDLLKKYIKTEVSDGSPEDMLNNAAKSMSSSHINYGFILIYKVLKSPVIHNIDLLINDDYIAARKLQQSSTTGVNQVTLDRTQTILPVPAQPTPDSITVFDDQHKPNSINRFYMIESIDGLTYRIIHPWGFHSKIYDIPSDMYNFLGNISITPSLRIESYNNIIESEIVNSIHERLSTKDLSQLYELKMEDSYWGGVRGKIRNIVIDNYAAKLKSYNQISENIVYRLTYDNTLNQKVVQAVAVLAQADLMEKMNIPTTSLREHFKRELALTYCANMLHFRNNFAARMREAYTGKYSKMVRKLIGTNKIENTISITHSLTSIFKQVLDDALASFINRFNGVFVATKNKLDILEKTLLI